MNDQTQQRKIQYIPLDQLKTSPVNVRKHGGDDLSDLLPSIRSIGVIQSLLVRPNCEGFEVVAGRRRLLSSRVVAEEDGRRDPLPCIILEDGDDATAIEASLAENIARLPMDDVDQYKAFAALKASGQTVAEIAAHFGVTDQLVTRRLAIANLHGPILTAYRKGDIEAETVRLLTMAKLAQQKAWFKRFRDPKDRAPTGRHLKAWLFGGTDIPVEAALFPLDKYPGQIVTDLFSEGRYFDDAGAFWTLQMEAVIEKQQHYLDSGWSDVVVLENLRYWSTYDKTKRSKKDGGKVYIVCLASGEVEFHEGWLEEKEAKRLDRAAAKANGEAPANQKPELTKAAIRYCELHRHNAVRAELLKAPQIALRVMVAHAVASCDLWDVKPEPQKANGNKLVEASIEESKAQQAFAKERKAIKKLLKLEDDREFLMEGHWICRQKDLLPVFARLTKLSDQQVMRVLAFAMGESLAAGTAIVEALGNVLNVDMAAWWEPEEALFELLRDKPAINTMVAEVAGKRAAQAHAASTAKVQKDVIKACLSGANGRTKVDGWMPRYMRFPMVGYTKRKGLPPVEQWQASAKLFKAAS